MGDRLVLWSGGGRYIASKDVADAAIVNYPERIEVNWGGGDKDFLTGVSWVPSQTLEATGNFSQSMSSSFNALGCSGTCKSGYWKLRFISDSLSPVTLIQTTSFANSCGRHYFYQFRQNGISISATEGLIFTACDTRFNNPNNWGAANSVLNSAYFALSFTGIRIYKIKVLSNTGQSSERITETNPDVSLLNAGCAIAITFTDNSSIEIPVNPCPEWVQVKPANSCPDGTVKECHHGATVCCFSCQNGRLTLTDQFNKVS